MSSCRRSTTEVLGRLEWIVRALAQDPDAQTALFPRFVCVPDELALAFEEALREARSSGFRLTSHQREIIEELDGELASMSGQANEVLWTEQALHSDPRWGLVRSTAKRVLDRMAWPKEPPLSSPDVYVEIRPEPVQMSWINKSLILECLRELSDRSLQLRLWLSAGQSEVSSFTEVVEQLFTDSALGEELQKHATGLGGAAENALVSLEKALARVNRKLPPDRLIDSAEMDLVRQLASAALAAM